MLSVALPPRPNRSMSLPRTPSHVGMTLSPPPHLEVLSDLRPSRTPISPVRCRPRDISDAATTVRRRPEHGLHARSKPFWNRSPRSPCSVRSFYALLDLSLDAFAYNLTALTPPFFLSDSLGCPWISTLTDITDASCSHTFLTLSRISLPFPFQACIPPAANSLDPSSHPSHTPSLRTSSICILHIHRTLAIEP